ncbi:hypothetical protein DQ384_36355 [Sphaerisporangium album]|uniref:DNA-binding protein n=1 Tax=Sphaerisporangium album TaxID=509200 RepID=A0A367EWI0_9ACTN|nr:helix-turn-helix domain-containing protein [Sphaerisporangium album]RCG21935.1 hypothetical protein DQ384_36355 [Sphaerisporangium album]
MPNRKPKTAPPRAPATASAPGDDPWLYFEDVCALHEIEVRTLRHLRAHGEGPPFIRVGRRLRIRRSQAQKWFTDKYERAGQ